MFLSLLFINLVYVIYSCSAKALKDGAPVIQTQYGAIQGYSEFDSFFYLGIPYATPPVDNNRWKAPVDPKPWSPNTLNATSFQPACPQSKFCSPQTACPPSV